MQAFLFLIIIMLDTCLVDAVSVLLAHSLLNNNFTFVKVRRKEDCLSNFWEKMEESRRARIGSSGGSADGPKFWNYSSTSSRLFENDTSIFSLDADGKVGEPTEINNGETSLHFWAPFCFKITQAECFDFFSSYFLLMLHLRLHDCTLQL